MRIKQITMAAGGLLGLALASPAALRAAEEGEPGLFSINLGLSIWTIVVFLLLLVLLKKFAWGPILTSVEEREHGIQSSLDEAARLRAEASELLEEHRRQMADSRRQANQIIAEAREAGEQVKREIEEKARTEGQRTIERARVEIEREKEKTVLAIRREAVDIALAAASELIRERLDQKADREFVTKYLDEVEAQPGASA